MKNNMIMTVVAVVVVGAAAFFGGMRYEQSKMPAAGSQFAGANGGSGAGVGSGGGQFGGRGRGGTGAGGTRPITGQIISADSKSITVQMSDGSTRIVLLSSTTAINKAAAATPADLQVGQRVNVFGSANTDGSLTAQNIQLNPMMMRPGGANGQGGSGAPQGSGGPTASPMIGSQASSTPAAY